MTRAADARATWLRARPPHVRAQVQQGFEITGNTVELFERRLDFRSKTEWFRVPIAKFKFVQTRALWQLYSMRRDLKWHSFDPFPTAGTFDILLREVERDRTGIFWG